MYCDLFKTSVIKVLIKQKALDSVLLLINNTLWKYHFHLHGMYYILFKWLQVKQWPRDQKFCSKFLTHLNQV